MVNVVEGKVTTILKEKYVRKQCLDFVRDDEVSFEAVGDRVGGLIAAKLKFAFIKTDQSNK